jgi:hypothetical protein
LQTTQRGFFIDAEVSRFTHEDYKGVKLDALVDVPTISFVGSIGGRVTAGGPVSGLIAAVNGLSDITDANGNYYIQDQDLAAGTYQATISTATEQCSPAVPSACRAINRRTSRTSLSPCRSRRRAAGCRCARW